MKLYVGNLSFDTTSEHLQHVFERYGEVSSIVVPEDKYTGKARGFAFVEMSSGDSAKAAIDGLDSKELNGRNLKVNEARPRHARGGADRPAQRRW